MLDRAVYVLDRFGAPIFLTLCLAFSLLMYALEPIAHGHAYKLAVRISLYLTALWLLYRWRPGWLTKKWFLTFFFMAGCAGAAMHLFTINPDAEIIHGYKSLFQVISRGDNPYTASEHYHLDAQGQIIYGNFNYPPMEIFPYLWVYYLLGSWNIAIYTVTLISYQSIACMILWWTFPKMKFLHLAAYFPFLIFYEIHTNVATTFLFTALIMKVIVGNLLKPQKRNRYLLWLLFGAGLLSKFFIIPVFCAYYLHQWHGRDLRSFIQTCMDISAVLMIALLLLAPFGIQNVLKNTLVFNLILEERAELTTYYPNVVSGFFSWINAEQLYPFFAVLIFAFSILLAPKLRVFPAVLTACITFMFVSATPEPQYIPVVLYMVLAGRFYDFMSPEKLCDKIP